MVTNDGVQTGPRHSEEKVRQMKAALNAAAKDIKLDTRSSLLLRYAGAH